MGIVSTAINQVLIMFAFMLIGYILRKSGKLPDNASKVLSTVLVYVCMPAISFSTCAENLTVNNILSQGKIIFLGTIVLAIGYLVAFLLAKVFAKDAFEKRIYTYSFTIPNITYMGLPIVGAVFGSQILFKMMMFIIPMYVFIYTKGITMLSKVNRKGIKSVLLQPIILAMIAGAIIGLTGFKLPKLINNITSTASGCMAPIAMMLTGCVIADKSIKELLCDKKAYFASLLRLIVLPLAALGVLLLLKVDGGIITVATITLAMPLGLNTVVFPEAYGGDGRKGAGLALISHTLAVITIPFIISILNYVL